MMKKTKKRGFTIVELVIVIAVIAILAAVLIPTFSGIIAKANESVALQEVQQAYVATLAEDLLKPAPNRQVSGVTENIVVKPDADKDIYISITPDGEASVLEGGKPEDVTHELVDGKLEKIPGNDNQGGGETEPNETEPNETEPGETEPGASEPETEPCEHIYNIYSYDDDQDTRQHTKTCRLCGDSVTESHLYTGVNKVCICTKEKTYVYRCYYKTQACDACDHTFTKAELNALSKCLIGGDEHDPDHYKCLDCGGCLVEVDPCSHTDYVITPTVYDSHHYLDCKDCLERIEQAHNINNGNGNCMTPGCGFHVHRDKYVYINIDTHRLDCVYSSCTTQEETKGHLFTNQDNKYIATATGHTANCYHCQNEPEEPHTPGDDGICTVCGFNTLCDHSTGQKIPVDEQYHRLTCCDTLVKHSINTNVCSACSAYVVSSSNYQTLKNNYASLQKKTIYIQANGISAWTYKLGISNKGAAVIDLCSSTLNYQPSSVVGGSFSVLAANYGTVTIRNGTIQASEAIINDINTYVVAGQMILENVTLISTG